MPVAALTKEGVISQVLAEFRGGRLHSGGSGKRVKSKKQALAIALSEARRRGFKVPKN
ncbi:MAG: DUF6496 domain-containing protein [candidate division Zixibacteria bacterium]|nr:DUF6496 domain-containing protein [candidate division Zixibacteria bacterium]